MAVPDDPLLDPVELDRGIGPILTYDPRDLVDAGILERVEAPWGDQKAYKVEEKLLTPYVMGVISANLGATEVTGNVGVQAVRTDQSSTGLVGASGARRVPAHGLAAASLRYFNVAGASGELGEDHQPETHLIPLVLQAAAGLREHVKVFGTDYPTRDGTAVRDYIHIEDLGEAHLLALDALEPGRTGSSTSARGDGYTVREVIDAARRVTGREIAVREEGRRAGDPPELVAANAKARATSSAGPRGAAWTR